LKQIEIRVNFVNIVHMKVTCTLRALLLCPPETSAPVFDTPFDPENRFAAQQLRIKIRGLLRQHAASQRNLRHLFHTHRLQGHAICASRTRQPMRSAIDENGDLEHEAQ
jgi:hypothetical protein